SATAHVPADLDRGERSDVHEGQGELAAVERDRVRLLRPARDRIGRNDPVDDHHEGRGMRLADLIDSRIVDADGRDIGPVGDVWLIQNGPPIGVFGAALTVDALVIGRFGLASRAGYEREGVRGPAPIAWYLRRRTAHRQVVPWSDVAALEEGRIRLRLPEDDLGSPSMGDEATTGRRVSAGLELLDRQLVDPEGMMA